VGRVVGELASDEAVDLTSPASNKGKKKCQDKRKKRGGAGGRYTVDPHLTRFARKAPLPPGKEKSQERANSPSHRGRRKSRGM